MTHTRRGFMGILSAAIVSVLSRLKFSARALRDPATPVETFTNAAWRDGWREADFIYVNPMHCIIGQWADYPTQEVSDERKIIQHAESNPHPDAQTGA